MRDPPSRVSYLTAYGAKFWAFSEVSLFIFQVAEQKVWYSVFANLGSVRLR